MITYPRERRRPSLAPSPIRKTSPKVVRVVYALIILGLSLGLLITLLVSLDNWTSAKDISTILPSATSGTSATVTPAPRPFVRQAGPAPIMPFPTTLQAQVSTLQARDRFFSHGSYILPEVALTFDDGPSRFTPQVLAILRHYKVQATFFCMGQHVSEHPDYVRQEQADGHDIGNHTWNHPHLPNLSSGNIYTELTNTGDIIQKVTGTRPTIFRPPYGEYDAHVLTTVNQLGLTTFLWNDMPRDWVNPQPAPEVITTRTLNEAMNGSIILLHDGGGDPRTNTVAALPSIIERLQARGLRLVKLTQMVNDAHKTSLALNTSSHVIAYSAYDSDTSDTLASVTASEDMSQRKEEQIF